MKKIYKILLNIALCTFGIGLVTGIVSSILYIQQTDYYAEYSETISGEWIDVIDIELSSGELIIKQGDTFSIQALNINPEEFTCKVEDHTWKIIEQTEENSFTIFGWRVSDDILARSLNQRNPKVMITIPEELILGTVKLCVNNGNMDLNTLLTQNLIIQVGAGRVKADNCVVQDSLQTQIGIGGLDAQGLVASNSIIECGISNIDITGDLDGITEINITAGITNLKINGLLDNIDYIARCDAGFIGIQDMEFSGIGIDSSYIGTDNVEIINVVCGIGKILLGY